MRTTRVALLCVALLPFRAMAQPAQASSPYAGQQERRIKALSDADVTGYLEGRGVGLALPAELNHYPGPRHVLDLADSLALTHAQRQQIRGVYETMHVEALSLGRAYIAVEMQIDSAFATRTITAATLDDLLRRSADTLRALRRTHLDAHLRVYPLLTREQVLRYDRLRGYDVSTPHSHAGHKPNP